MDSMRKRLHWAAGALLLTLLFAVFGGSAFAQMPAPRDNQTLLKISIGRGHLIASFNSKLLGTFGPTNLNNGGKDQPLYVDVSSYAHAGPNSLRLAWNEPQTPTGSVEVMYAAQSRRFKSVSRRTIVGNEASRLDETSTITLPDTASAIPGAAPGSPAGEILEPVTAGPPFTPADNQTILDIALTEGGAAVFINETRVRFSNANGMGRADISSLVHPGQNSIRVQGSRGTGLRGMLKISYAVVKNNFRLMRIIDWSGKNAGKSADTGTFNMAGQAGK